MRQNERRGTQELGKVVEPLRKVVGYNTQEEFAYAAGINHSIYNRLTRHATRYLVGAKSVDYLRGIIYALIQGANGHPGIDSMQWIDTIIRVWPRQLSEFDIQQIRKGAEAQIAHQKRKNPTPATSVAQGIVDQSYGQMYTYLLKLSAEIKKVSQTHQQITQRLENLAKEIDNATLTLHRYLYRDK